MMALIAGFAIALGAVAWVLLPVVIGGGQGRPVAPEAAPVGATFCSNCGDSLERGARFCSSCGEGVPG